MQTLLHPSILIHKDMHINGYTYTHKKLHIQNFTYIFTSLYKYIEIILIDEKKIK